MTLKVTRRKLAATLVSGTALAQAAAQQPPSSSSADADLKTARDRLVANAVAVGAVSIPMATEPAFQFKA